MRTTDITLVSIVALATALQATEFHVARTGKDSNAGTQSAPFLTIQYAANLAQPGDVITVHEGTYRERINPPRGGESDTKRIIYQAATGKKVEIKGSEIITGWVRVTNDTWQATVPNTLFGTFNPYSDLIKGDWFNPKKRKHHTGAVYLNGEWLTEAAKQEEVMKPIDKTPFWFGTVDSEKTTLLAQFKGVDPNKELVEINVRQTVFYPDQPGRNYITVRGFTMCHAATPWAPPTAEQIGLIGTHWSKGWVIENNTISHSVCSGIALGKHGDKFDNTSANSAEGYVKTIERAHAFSIPWTKEHIGSHVVRSNEVSYCEQAGIVGSLGCAFSTVTDNNVHHVHVRQLFTGAEMGALKFHGAIDTVISRNKFSHSIRGVWLDWMAQGTRISRNLFFENTLEDVFAEVNHGPFLFDNNLFLSKINVSDWSQGSAYVHNLFAGQLLSRPELSRETPYHPAHSTTVSGLQNIKGGDNRFYNNIFVGNGTEQQAAPSSTEKPVKKSNSKGFGLYVYNERPFPSFTGGNIYFDKATPYHQEKDAVCTTEKGGPVMVVEEGKEVYLQAAALKGVRNPAAQLVTTERLGMAKIPQLPYVNADGSPIKVDMDYFGNARSAETVLSGPFEKPVTAGTKVKVW
jgi:alpha-N-arabinofuranosidase